MNETPKELDAAVKVILDYKPQKDKGEQTRKPPEATEQPPRA